MEYKNLKFWDKLNKIGDEVENAIKEIVNELLKDTDKKSIYFAPYVREGWIGNYYFYDCNKDGDGEALELRILRVDDKGNIELEYDTNFGDYFGRYEVMNWSVSERVYILEMLEELYHLVKEEGEVLLAEGEDFDDYED